MGTRRRRPADLGDEVRGWVLDRKMWDGQSAKWVAIPKRWAVGNVTTVYPHAPDVVEILVEPPLRRTAGERVLIRLGSTS